MPRFNVSNFKSPEDRAFYKARKEKIVEMRSSGSSFGEISKLFKISASRCAKVYRAAEKDLNASKTRLWPGLSKKEKIVDLVRNALESYLPCLILKNESFIWINESLLFLILNSKTDYLIKNPKGTCYIKFLVNFFKDVTMIRYNELLTRFGEKQLSEKWGISDNSSVPSCFWNDKGFEDFLKTLQGAKTTLSREVTKQTMSIIDVKVEAFKSSQDKILEEIRPFQNTESLIKEVEELKGYITILKDDSSLKREDCIVVLEDALDCLYKFEKALSTQSNQPVKTVCEDQNQTAKHVEDVKPKIKPKAFWPKPRI